MAWFSYSVIKFIPDPIKGEIVNIGVLASAKNGSFKSKITTNFAELEKRYDIKDSELLQMMLQVYSSPDRRSETYLKELSKQSNKDHRLKITSPYPINVPSIDDAVNEVYSDMISIPEKLQREKIRNVQTIACELSSKIRIDKKFIKKNHNVQGVETNSKYDMVFKNGKVTDILQIIAFDGHDKDKSLYKSKSFLFDSKDLYKKDEQISCLVFVPKPQAHCIQYEQSIKILSSAQYCKLAKDNTIDGHLDEIADKYSIAA